MVFNGSGDRVSIPWGSFIEYVLSWMCMSGVLFQLSKAQHTRFHWVLGSVHKMAVLFKPYQTDHHYNYTLLSICANQTADMAPRSDRR
jgi:hypothetical protein